MSVHGDSDQLWLGPYQGKRLVDLFNHHPVFKDFGDDADQATVAADEPGCCHCSGRQSWEGLPWFFLTRRPGDEQHHLPGVVVEHPPQHSFGRL